MVQNCGHRDHCDECEDLRLLLNVMINTHRKLRAMDIGLIRGIAEAHAGTHSWSYIRRVIFLSCLDFPGGGWVRCLNCYFTP